MRTATTLIHAALLAGLGFATPAFAVDLPADATPEEEAAFRATTQSCSGCHQQGMLDGVSEPMGDFGYVLDLRRLAEEGKYVQAGNPDGSPIVIFASGTDDHSFATLDEAGLAALRAWIESLPAQ
jgi:mono/diheme cytochrome c family protein